MKKHKVKIPKGYTLVNETKTKIDGFMTITLGLEPIPVYQAIKKQEPWFSPSKAADITKAKLIFDEFDPLIIRITEGKEYAIVCLLIYNDGSHRVKINDDSNNLQEIREYSNVYITRMIES